MPVTTSTSAVVALRDVSVALGGSDVLRGVSTHVDAGEAVALLGANGSGKSTLVRAVLGLVAHRGEVELFGTPQARFRTWRRIGYVPQYSAATLLRATVWEVASSGRLGHRRPFTVAGPKERRLVHQTLSRVGLEGRERSELRELSGGQRQRVLIARALVTEPDLLVLDEPLAGIDVPTQSHLAGLLAGFKEQGMAMLVVLHELGPLDPLMDRAVVLERGILTYDGAPRAVPADRHPHHPDDEVSPGPPPILDGHLDHVTFGDD